MVVYEKHKTVCFTLRASSMGSYSKGLLKLKFNE